MIVWYGTIIFVKNIIIIANSWGGSLIKDMSQYMNLNGFIKREYVASTVIPTRFVVEYDQVRSQGKGIVQELLEKYQLCK